MLNPDLTLNAGRSAQTLPGTNAAIVFESIAGPSAASTVRRVTASYLTTPQTLTLSQTHKGSGWNEVVTSLVKYTYEDTSVDPALTGGVRPKCTVNVTVTRPVRSGGVITAAKLKDGIGFCIDALLQSGHIDKILAEQT